MISNVGTRARDARDAPVGDMVRGGRQELRIRRWVVIGMLGALAGALRVPFALVPSVQPSTALIIVSGQALGARVGLGVGIVVPLVSNVFLGHGPWTVMQALAWGGIGLCSGVLPHLGRAGLVAWGVMASLTFGLTMDLWLWAAFASPHTLSTALPLLVRGIPFNVAHAVATGGILFWAGPRLQILLSRGRVRILGLAPRRAAWLARS